jgi:hypothetical protein
MMWNSGPPFPLSIPFLHTQLSVLFWWQRQQVSLQPLYLYQTTWYHIPEHGNLLNHNSLFSSSDIQPVVCLVWNRWAKHYTAIFCDILALHCNILWHFETYSFKSCDVTRLHGYAPCQSSVYHVPISASRSYLAIRLSLPSPINIASFC